MAINIGLKGGFRTQQTWKISEWNIPGTGGGVTLVQDTVKRLDPFNTGDALNTIGGTIIGFGATGGQMTLPPGNYEVNAHATQYRSDRSRIHLFNVTANAVAVLGMAGFGLESVAIQSVRNTLAGRFSIDVESVFELRHWTNRAGLDTPRGKGMQSSDGVGPEWYASIEFRKLK